MRLHHWVGQIALAGLIGLGLAACSGASATTPEPRPEGPRLPTVTPTAAAPAATPATATPPAELPPTEAAPAEVPTPAAPVFDPATTTIVLQPVTTDLDQPLFVTHAGDGSGRIFVVEKQGRIRIVREGQTVATPFLDLSDRVRSTANEQGLLGLAFAPNYAETGHFFVNYTDANGDTVVSRFTTPADTPDQADPGSEFVVLAFDQPAANHNGGMVTFGPDGYLWIGTGDGGGANDRFGNGQNPATFLGKLLRLDVTSDPTVPYAVPPDNPWVAADWNGQDVIDEAWALGLRNPWRFTFDRATGDLWIADVGQNQIEEVNFVAGGNPGGLNFGWPILEGTHCFQSGSCDPAGTVLPVLEYDHGGGHCSITGGNVYRGSQFPALQGVYFYGDFCSGVIWAAMPAGDGWSAVEVMQSGMSISSFGEDEAGEQYLTDLGGGLYQVTAE
jgi:glucose/arabinose dehydrogenase